MLVLALQFSRCDVTLAEPAPEDVARRSGVGGVVSNSLKTEEKTVVVQRHHS